MVRFFAGNSCAFKGEHVEKQDTTGGVGRFKLTIIASLAALVCWKLHVIFDLDTVERIAQALSSLEGYELDELLLSTVFIIIGISLDVWRFKIARDAQIRIDKERMAVLKSTMRTVDDIVGNFLHQLQLFTLQENGNERMSQESIQRLQGMIFETSTKLSKIQEGGDIKGSALSDEVPMLR